jgi:phage-related protein
MNVFELFAKISLDSSEYEKCLGDSEQKTSSFGEKLKSGLQTAAKVGGAAITAASGAVVTFTKSAVSSYADFEQLEGGVQKLYGNMGMSLKEYAASSGKTVDEVRDEWQRLEDAQNLVFNNAKNAYRTAGMDMNSYMEAATSFSASLINSLGGDTVKAAEQTDVAMRAISDNFNTFGGDIESVQNAFMGFSKGQFNLLDNLRLGYAGTKEGMQSLIADANEYAKANGQAANLSIDSFSDIVTAIDLVQQKQNIAGTTQREAASTIAGSLMMTKAAWQNLVTGITDSNADIDSLLSDVVTSAEAAFGNILPAVERALSGIASLIEKIAPLIAEKLPSLVKTVLPSLLGAATSLLNGVIAALPSLIQVLVEQIPTVVTTLITGIVETLPMFLDAGAQIVQSLTQGMSIDEMITKAGELLTGFVEKALDYLPDLLDAGIEFVDNMAQGVGNNLPAIMDAIGTVISRLITLLTTRMPEFLQKGIELISRIANGIINNLPTIISSLVQVIVRLIATLAQNFPQFLQKGIELIGQLASGLIRAIPNLIRQIPTIIRSIVQAFGSYDWGSIGRNLIDGIKNGIFNAGRNLVSAAISVVANAWNSMKSWLGIASPSKKAEKILGKNWVLGIGEGFTKNMPAVEDEMVGAVEDAFGAIGDSMTVPDFAQTSTYSVSDGGRRTGSFAPVFNIYAREGQDVESLADLVMERLTFLYEREGAAYGTA